MDHEAFENEMFDAVNRHAEEQSGQGETGVPKVKLLTKKDTSALKNGLKRMIVALFTAFLFGLSVFAFIATATATGYWAVLLFLSAIVLLVWAFVFLYAQGISPKGEGGKYEEKE